MATTTQPTKRPKQTIPATALVRLMACGAPESVAREEYANMVPLLPRHGIGVWVFTGDGQRFARCWRATWQRLSPWARRQILRHWRDAPEDFRHPVIRPSPCIELRDDMLSRRKTVLGSTADQGHRLQFRASMFARMPDDVASEIIAHELAHVCQYAIDEPYMFDRKRATKAKLEAIENAVFDWLDDWGFDQGIVDHWAVANGVWKPLTAETR